MSASYDSLAACPRDAQTGDPDSELIRVPEANLESAVTGFSPCLSSPISNNSARDVGDHKPSASHEESGTANDLSLEMQASTMRTLHRFVPSIPVHGMQPQRTAPMPPPVSMI